MKTYYLTSHNVQGSFARNTVYFVDLNSVHKLYYFNYNHRIDFSCENINSLMRQVEFGTAREILESEVVLILGFLP